MLRVKRSQNPDAAAAANSVIVLSIEGEIWCVSICTAGCYDCKLNWSQFERKGGRESRHHTHGLCTALSKHGINHTQQFITNHFNTHGERCNWSRFACVYFFPSHRLNDAIDIVSGGSWTGSFAGWLLVLLECNSHYKNNRPTDKWLRSFWKLYIIYCTLSRWSTVVFALTAKSYLFFKFPMPCVWSME